MKIFVNPSGQRENLGDSLLRRAYLDALRRNGVLHVLTGADASYVSGLGTQGSDVLYSSKRRWLLAALSTSLRERTVFAVNAGEVVTGLNYLSTWLWQNAISFFVHVRGGSVVMMGSANREEPSATRVLLRNFCKHVDLLTWRDRASVSLFAKGREQPDWAVALGQRDDLLDGDAGGRDSVVISLRGDRPAPSMLWFSAVKGALALLGSPPVYVVVQVERDENRAQEVAARLSGSVVSWPVGRTHLEQEEILRDVYGRAICVISDRIHALIVGLTEGAVPVGFTPQDPRKVAKTFAVIASSVEAWSADVESVTAEEHAERIYAAASNRSAVISELQRARGRLNSVVKDLERVLEKT